MTFVVTENCIKCKYTDCVDVCPVDCFHEGPNFLVIDPDECIDCTLCEPECPAEAIFSEDDLPDEQMEFLQINEELSRVWPVLSEKKDPCLMLKSGMENRTKRHCWKDNPIFRITTKKPALSGLFYV